MYNPRDFRQQESAVLHGLIRGRPLATLVVQGSDGFDAVHVPLLLDPAAGDHGVLRGHVARANPLWRAATEEGCTALAIFHGPQAYVSPSWYPSKREHGKVVPTWNYAVVHAHGTLTAIDDPAWLHALVTALTDTHEATHPEPWKVGDAPVDFVTTQLRAIVGIELHITRLEGKWKMSQNRAAGDRDGGIAGLTDGEGGGDADVATVMRAVRDGADG